MKFVPHAEGITVPSSFIALMGVHSPFDAQPAPRRPQIRSHRLQSSLAPMAKAATSQRPIAWHEMPDLLDYSQNVFGPAHLGDLTAMVTIRYQVKSLTPESHFAKCDRRNFPPAFRFKQARDTNWLPSMTEDAVHRHTNYAP